MVRKMWNIIKELYEENKAFVAVFLFGTLFVNVVWYFIGDHFKSVGYTYNDAELTVYLAILAIFIDNLRNKKKDE